MKIERKTIFFFLQRTSGQRLALTRGSLDDPILIGEVCDVIYELKSSSTAASVSCCTLYSQPQKGRNVFLVSSLFRCSLKNLLALMTNISPQLSNRAGLSVGRTYGPIHAQLNCVVGTGRIWGHFAARLHIAVIRIMQTQIFGNVCRKTARLSSWCRNYKSKLCLRAPLSALVFMRCSILLESSHEKLLENAEAATETLR